MTQKNSSEGDGIPAELFKILKGDAVKVLHSTCQQIWKTQQWPQDWKMLVFIPTPKKAMPKNVQTTTQMHVLTKSWSKSSKLGFNSLWTENFQMYKLDLEKAEEPEIKLPASVGSYKNQANSRETSTSISLTTVKYLWRLQQTVEHSLSDGNTGPPYLPPEKPVCTSRSNS